MEKTRTRREMGVFVAGEGRRGGREEGAGRSGGGDKWREERQERERGLRREEEAVSAPEWEVGGDYSCAGAGWLAALWFFPNQETENGWMDGVGGAVEAVGRERERCAHGVRAHHFLLYYSCFIITIPH
jgi:hypothetical protein